MDFKKGLAPILLAAFASFFPPTARAATTLTIQQYIELSEMAYYPGGDPNMDHATAPAGFKLVWVSSGSKSGFSASAFEHSATQAVVVSYMGTYNVKDALADIGIGEDDIGSAENAAMHAAEGEFEKIDPKAVAFIKKAPNISLKPNAVLLAQIKQATNSTTSSPQSTRARRSRSRDIPSAATSASSWPRARALTPCCSTPRALPT